MLSVTALRRLAALSLTLVCACSRTTDSTETGNPPVIAGELIALVAESGEVHVVGEPKAIRPGGGKIEVTTLASGDTARGPIAKDGSFDVAVVGTLADTYRLRVVGAQASSEPVYVDRDGVTDPPDGGADVDAGALSCEDRVTLIGDRIAAVEQDHIEGCSSNDDCGELAWPGRCPFACRGVAVAYATAPAATSALDAISTSLCEPFEADGCFDGLPQPACLLPPPIACVDARCTRCDGAACPETSCDACTTPLVTWSTGGATGGTYMLEDCTTLTFTPVGGQPPCTRELLCVPSTANDQRNTAARLQNALGHPDVRAALAANETFGQLTPGGFGLRLSVGDNSIFASDVACAGAASCTDEPDAVATLRGVLQSLADDPTACDSGAMPAP